MNIKSGPVPIELDPRLKNRDTKKLQEGALLKFQVINRGKNPQHNYRWLLYEDGRLHFAKHSGNTSDWQIPFDTPLPDRPTANLSKHQVKKIRELLKQEGFFSEPPYQLDTDLDDGGFYIVRASVSGKEHEVIFIVGSYPPLVAYLLTIADTLQ